MQQHVRAAQRRIGEQPAGLALERLQAGQQLRRLLARKVGHHADDPQPRRGHDVHCVALALVGAHLQAVAAHPGRVQRQMHVYAAAVLARDRAEGARRGQAADQFLDLPAQRPGHLLLGGRAHPHQLALEAAVTRHARFLVAGNTHVGDARADEAWHDELDAHPVSIGLHHRADPRTAHYRLADQPQVVFEHAQVHFDPGIGCPVRPLALPGQQRRSVQVHGSSQGGAQRGGDELPAIERRGAVGHAIPHGSSGSVARIGGDYIALPPGALPGSCVARRGTR